MTPGSKGCDLFLVDNSVSGWTGLCYLEEWSGIAKSFDIATGYFEISSLRALDSKWQTLDKIRILMGAETTQRTHAALLEVVRSYAIQALGRSIESTKDGNLFLHGVRRSTRDGSVIEAHVIINGGTQERARSGYLREYCSRPVARPNMDVGAGKRTMDGSVNVKCVSWCPGEGASGSIYVSTARIRSHAQTWMSGPVSLPGKVQ